jgi:Arc/MetJ-type ribon-helix-helix transcriptional regulator
MMNRYPFYLSYLILLIAAQPAYTQMKFRISGQLSGGAGQRLYFSSDNYVPSTDKKKLYSARIDSADRFRLTGKVAHAGLYTVFVEGRQTSLTFFLDTVPVLIEGTADSISGSRITGSPEQVKRKEWENMSEATRQALNDTSRMYMIETRLDQPDRQAIKQYRKTMDSLTRVMQDRIEAFATANPDSWQTLDLLNNYAGLLLSYEKAETYLPPLAKKFSLRPEYLKLLKSIRDYKRSKQEPAKPGKP